MFLIIATVLALVSLSTYAGGWISDTTSSCQVWNPSPSPGETINWSGVCANGKAAGKGRLQWYVNGKPSEQCEVGFRDGLIQGTGKCDYANGNRYDGEWLDSRYSGKGTYTWANGTSREGEWLNDKAHGFSTSSITRGDTNLPSWEERQDGKWIKDRYIVQGLWREGKLILKCSSKTECERQVAAEEKSASEYANRPYREGDSICVRQWQGTGYCGNVDRVAGDRLKVEISKVDCGGFIGQCNPNPCSGDKTIGPKGNSGVSGVGDSVWTEKYCVTSR